MTIQCRKTMTTYLPCPDCGTSVPVAEHVAAKLNGEALCTDCQANRAEHRAGV